MAEPNVYWAGTPNYTSGNDGIMFLFPHWTEGGFAGSVSTLQNPNRQASAHYVIEGGKVAQLVHEGDTAWHCGNWYYNRRSISYELVGWTGNPPSYDTLDTCARMMAQASRDYFGGAKLVLGENVMLHKWVSSTNCPGQTDIGWLVDRANYYLEEEDMPSAQEIANAVWDKDINGHSAGERLYLDNVQLFDRKDYSGRGKDGSTPIERITWLAAKQEAMQESINKLQKSVDALTKAVAALSKNSK
jgi:hypothetical protein